MEDIGMKTTELDKAYRALEKAIRSAQNQMARQNFNCKWDTARMYEIERRWDAAMEKCRGWIWDEVEADGKSIDADRWKRWCEENNFVEHVTFRNCVI